MAIPIRMQLLWKALSGLGAGSIYDVPASELPAARERRKRLLALPGSSTIVGKVHPEVLASTKSVDGADGATIAARI
jgi:hypothetical protein